LYNVFGERSSYIQHQVAQANPCFPNAAKALAGHLALTATCRRSCASARLRNIFGTTIQTTPEHGSILAQTQRTEGRTHPHGGHRQ
jgi:hypothetical protein